MPKPLIDDDDPNLPRLNEVLVDFITKNIWEVSGKTLVFADVISLLMSPVGFLFALLNSAFLFCTFLLIGLVSSIYLDALSVPYALILTVLLTGIFSRHLRHYLSGVIFRLLNLSTYGHLIKVICGGYQSNEPISHHLLRSESAFLSLLGTYAETLNVQKRNQYHRYINIYQRSRYKDDGEFEEMISRYWSENIK